jgi:hypothetical protein
MTEIRDNNGAMVRRGGRLGRWGLAAPATTDGGSTQQTLSRKVGTAHLMAAKLGSLC